MIARVFVYGTLMHEQPNHRVLVELGARRIGEAITTSARTLVDLGPYPALLPIDAARDATGSRVAGEIYEIDDAQLAPLDAFEGCPDLYTREPIALQHDGGVVEAWTYVLARTPPSHAVVVATGRYGGGGVVLTVDAREVPLDAPSDKRSDGRSPEKKR